MNSTLQIAGAFLLFVLPAYLYLRLLGERSSWRSERRDLDRKIQQARVDVATAKKLSKESLDAFFDVVKTLKQVEQGFEEHALPSLEKIAVSPECQAGILEALRTYNDRFMGAMPGYERLRLHGIEVESFDGVPGAVVLFPKEEEQCGS